MSAFTRDVEAAILASFFERFARLDELQRIAVLTLLEILEFGETRGDDSAENPLGCFLHHLLIDVARDGVAETSADLPSIRARLEAVYEYVEYEVTYAARVVAMWTPERLAVLRSEPESRSMIPPPSPSRSP